jgi:hypothetical protein
MFQNELDDFDIEETKVLERQPLKRLKKTLLSFEAFEKKNKQVSPIETHEEDSLTNLKKNCGRPLGSNNIKKNPIVNNVVQKRNVLPKKGETPQTTYKNILCITLDLRIITKYTLGRVLIHTNGSNNICVNHPRK